MAKKTNKKLSKQKPVRVNPSGKREESFFELVYEIARQIPRGRVTSYGAIAACLGTKMSARMVGWAMNGAHHSKLKVPAHRVVNRNGMLSGKHHFGDPDAMQRLLEKENIKVVDDQVQDFDKVFWNPGEIS
jgi:methylated-DNA-protein-cysteine methyltransferase-like protein